MAHTSSPTRFLRSHRLLLTLCLFFLASGVALCWQYLPRQAELERVEVSVFHEYDNCGGVIQVTLYKQGPGTLKGKMLIEELTAKDELVQSETVPVAFSKKSHTYKIKMHILSESEEIHKLRVTFNGQSQTFAIRDIYRSSVQNLSATVCHRWHAGTDTAIHISLHNYDLHKKRQIIDEYNLIIELTEKNQNPSDKKPVYELYKGKRTGKDGPEMIVSIPKVKPGHYCVSIETRSKFGRKATYHFVEIVNDARILLVTDKPVYQPGQTMQLRAMVLSPMNLKPVADREILLEVLDGKDNRVFKTKQKTSKFGIVSAEFDLANQVNTGEYTIKANMDEIDVQKTVMVKSYKLPKFKVQVLADKKFYSSKQDIGVEIRGDYFFGKPIAQAKVLVEAIRHTKGDPISFLRWTGETDAKGRLKMTVPLQKEMKRLPLGEDDEEIEIEVTLTDNADHTEKVTRRCMVSDKPIKASLVPEGGQLIPGLENKISVVAIYANGAPAPCEVTIWPGKKAQGKPLAIVTTNELGLGEFSFTPQIEHLRPSRTELVAGNITHSLLYHPIVRPQVLMDLIVQAKDDNGNIAERYGKLKSQPVGDNLLLRADKSIYQVGDVIKLDLFANEPIDTVYLDVSRNEQSLLRRTISLPTNRSHYELPLPQDIFGSVMIHAYHVTSAGEIVGDRRLVYIQPVQELNIAVEQLKESYRPGDQARLKFVVTDKKGQPQAAALGLTVVDEAIFGVQELQPGLEKAYFTLHKRLQKAQLSGAYLLKNNIEDYVRLEKLTKDQNQMMGVLLTAAGLNAPEHQIRDQRSNEDYLLKQHSVYSLQQKIFQLALLNPAVVMNYDMNKKQWQFHEDLLSRLAEAGLLPDFVDATSGTPTLADLKKHNSSFRAETLAKAIDNYRMQTLGYALEKMAKDDLEKALQWNPKQKQWSFHADVLQRMVKGKYLTRGNLKTLNGEAVTLEQIQQKHPGFNVNNLLRSITEQRLNSIWDRIYSPDAPADIAVVSKIKKYLPVEMYSYLEDPWKKTIDALLFKEKDRINVTYRSAGADGKFNTIDDIQSNNDSQYLQYAWWEHPDDPTNPSRVMVYRKGHFAGPFQEQGEVRARNTLQRWYLDQFQPNYWRDKSYRNYFDGFGYGGFGYGGFGIGSGLNLGGGFGYGGFNIGGFQSQLLGGVGRSYAFGGFNIGGGFGGGGFNIGGGIGGPALPIEEGGPGIGRLNPNSGEMSRIFGFSPTQGESKNANTNVRLRDYFPETMLWRPQILTDDQGQATVAVNMADSITTWRLSASANSLSGTLGGKTIPLKVFQDFFVDIDAPLALTQNDEIELPIAIFNYLKTPQTIRLKLEKGDWYELLGDQHYERQIDLKANEVTSAKFRIRVLQAGTHGLTAVAVGSKLSDAVKRPITVIPDGKQYEKVINAKLSGKQQYLLEIPEKAVAGSFQHRVKVYPGIMAELVEGLEGMMRMPYGCFEQTSSSAYPNIMIMSYLQKQKRTSPALLAKAKTYLNASYQRLLTFEHPNGGFSLWGPKQDREPTLWLSAYAMHQFSDMAKVWDVDPKILKRTADYLWKKQSPDGSWSDSDDVVRNLEVTCYVAWSLFPNSTNKDAEKQKTLEFIRKHINQNSPSYTLALAANALAELAPKDELTLAVLGHLQKSIQKNQGMNMRFVSNGNRRTLSSSWGTYGDVETTALTVLALEKLAPRDPSATDLLGYLVKTKSPQGTWGTTSATILSLKALTLAGPAVSAENLDVIIRLDDTVVAKGEVSLNNFDVVQHFDLGKYAKKGKQQLSIEVDGETNANLQIVTSYYLPWDQQTRGTLKINAQFNRLRLPRGEKTTGNVTVKCLGDSPAHNVMVELPVPPGFSVNEDEFAAMRVSGKIKQFEISNDRVTLYLADIDANNEKTFEYTLNARLTGTMQARSIRAYEYYRPDNVTALAPMTFTVSDTK